MSLDVMANASEEDKASIKAASILAIFTDKLRVYRHTGIRS